MPQIVSLRPELEAWLRKDERVSDFAALRMGDASVLLVVESATLSAIDVGHQLAADFDLHSQPCAVVRDRLRRNGTVDADAAYESARSVEHYRFAAPRSPEETALAEIWSSVLGLPVVGVEDDFIDLGGDSFGALEISLQAEQRGLPMDAVDLYDHGTIRAVVAAVTGRSEDPGTAEGTRS